MSRVYDQLSNDLKFQSASFEVQCRNLITLETPGSEYTPSRQMLLQLGKLLTS